MNKQGESDEGEDGREELFRLLSDHQTWPAIPRQSARFRPFIFTGYSAATIQLLCNLLTTTRQPRENTTHCSGDTLWSSEDVVLKKIPTGQFVNKSPKLLILRNRYVILTDEFVVLLSKCLQSITQLDNRCKRPTANTSISSPYIHTYIGLYGS